MARLLPALRTPADAALLSEAAGHHHERRDGTGYPDGLREQQVSPLTRLLAVCDVYAAGCCSRLTVRRETRTALTDVLLLAEQGSLDSHFAERLLQLSFYPAGAVVELADGAVAVVAAPQSPRRELNAPARPVVALLIDADNHFLPAPRYVDLAQCDSHSIVRTLPPAERRVLRPLSRMGRVSSSFPEGTSVSASSEYLRATRHPWPCFLFLLPLLVTYEVGVFCLGGGHPELLRNGADNWLRQGLAGAGLRQHFWTPALLLVVLGGWNYWRRQDRPGDLVGVLSGMGIESVGFALGLWGISRTLGPLVDYFGLELSTPGASNPAGTDGHVRRRGHLRGIAVPPAAVLRPAGAAAPGQRGAALAVAVAGIASAMFFSAAHHLGPYGEPFEGYTFLFRTVAGLTSRCSFSCAASASPLAPTPATTLSSASPSAERGWFAASLRQRALPRRVRQGHTPPYMGMNRCGSSCSNRERVCSGQVANFRPCNVSRNPQVSKEDRPQPLLALWAAADSLRRLSRPPQPT